MLDFSRFDWLSFDCYGTLIDWESGILGYLRPLLQGKGCKSDDAEILTLYSEFEPRSSPVTIAAIVQCWPAVVRDFAHELHFDVTDDEADGLPSPFRRWPPFAGYRSRALQRLHSRYKLAILSNIDDDLFAYPRSTLEVPFDAVVTAEQVHSYKPSLNNFEALLRRLRFSRERLLHVAESLYHDVVPARSLGIATVWVNRRKGRPAAATKLVAAQPDLEVSNLAALADLTDCLPGDFTADRYS